VEFQGIKVGSVLDFRLEYDDQKTEFRIPVLIEIEPERIIERRPANAVQDSPYDTLDTLIAQGLRARLQTGSLLTGQLYVELSMQPDTPIALHGGDTQYPELPTIASASFESITRSVEEFVAKLDGLDLEQIGSELLTALQGANQLINAPEVQASVKDLRASLASFRSILAKVDDSNLDQAINAGHGALENLNRTLELANTLLTPDSPLHYNLIQLTGELEETARSIRSLVDLLQREPQSFIFGKDTGGEDDASQ